MSRKRKEAPAQSSTLHNFFQAPGRLTPNNLKSFSRNQPSAKLVKHESQEVIIIDSDEEIEVQVLGHSRPKVVDGQLSDVEIVEAKPLVRPVRKESSILRETPVQLANSKIRSKTSSPPTLAPRGNDENVVPQLSHPVTSHSPPRTGRVREESLLPKVDVLEMRKIFYDEGELTECTLLPQDVETSQYEIPGDDQNYAMDWDVNMADDELDYFPQGANGTEESHEDLKVQARSDAPEGRAIRMDITTDECCPMCGLTFRDLIGLVSLS